MNTCSNRCLPYPFFVFQFREIWFVSFVSIARSCSRWESPSTTKVTVDLSLKKNSSSSSNHRSNSFISKTTSHRVERGETSQSDQSSTDEDVVFGVSILGVFHRLDGEPSGLSFVHSIAQGLGERDAQESTSAGGASHQGLLCQGKSLCLSTRGGHRQDLRRRSRRANGGRTEITGPSGLETECYFCGLWVCLPGSLSILVDDE